MEQLWAPWRMDYILGPKPDTCVFCLPEDTSEDRERLVLARGKALVCGHEQISLQFRTFTCHTPAPRELHHGADRG
jgi:hypothetical protein